MSFRELRNFTEIMRALGYPRKISVDNFRTPNFELVADVLFWMVGRYDPEIRLKEDIETEDDRVEFLTGASQALAAKARIKLNSKRLYAADGRAVKELLKVAQVLYSAARTMHEDQEEDPDTESSALPSQLKNVKGARTLATEITERGARLFDLLGNETDVRVERSKALKFLDAISGNLDNTSEHEFVERRVKEAVNAIRENIESMKRQSDRLVEDEKILDGKIKRRQADLERQEKRLRSLQSVRPAFMDEYEKLEMDLHRYYEAYVERFRNLDYLEHELDTYHEAEKEKLEENERSWKLMQRRIREEEVKDLQGHRYVEDRHAGNPPASTGPYDGRHRDYNDSNRAQPMDTASTRRESDRRREGNIPVQSTSPIDDDSDVSTPTDQSDESASIESEDLSSGSGSELAEGDSDGSESDVSASDGEFGGIDSESDNSDDF